VASAYLYQHIDGRHKFAKVLHQPIKAFMLSTSPMAAVAASDMCCCAYFEEHSFLLCRTNQKDISHKKRRQRKHAAKSKRRWARDEPIFTNDTVFRLTGWIEKELLFDAALLWDRTRRGLRFAVRNKRCAPPPTHIGRQHSYDGVAVVITEVKVNLDMTSMAFTTLRP